MTMSEPSLLHDSRQMVFSWMQSAAGSPARTSASRDEALALRVSAAACGLSMPGSLASYDPATSSWRTSQLCLDGGLERFSETWPRSGLTRSGTAYPLRPLARPTDATASGLWPTPTCSDQNTGSATSERRDRPYGICLADAARIWPTPKRSDDRIGMPNRVGNPARHGGWNLNDWVARWPTPTISGNHNRKGASATSGDGLSEAVQVWPTPAARDYRSPSLKAGTDEYFRKPTSGLPLNDAVGGALNPTWVEWLMGLPAGWTDCGPSATRSSRKSLS